MSWQGRVKTTIALGVLAAVGISSLAPAAQFSVSGHHRFELDGIFNPDATDGGINSKTYWTHRLYLRPTLLIDDHFSVHTEWKILELENGLGTHPSNGGAVAGSGTGSPADGCLSLTSSCHYFGVTRVWLDWTQDWGQFRVGRAPRQWGLGMIYNAGNSAEDDFQFTEDLLQYTLPLGFIYFGGGFGKRFEGSVGTESDDQEDYFLFLNYDNPEIELNAGFLYNRALKHQLTLGKMSYHLIDIFAQKRWGSLKVGGEFGYVFGGNVNNTTGASQDISSFGLMGNAEFKYDRFLTSGFLAFAAGDQTPGDSSISDFSFFSRNIRPALILFREDVAAVNSSGSYDSIKNAPGIGQFRRDGAFVFKIGETISITEKWSSSLDFIYAMLITTGTSTARDLGFEFDLSTKYQWYENFATTAAFGYHVTGDAYKTNPADVWALQVKGVLNF